jgi:hypothetical protein
MRHLLAAIGIAAFVILAAPTAQATAVSLDAVAQSLPEDQIAFTKGGHGKGGWKGGKHGRAYGHHRGRHYRGGPPPWAPAHGWRRKHRW